MQENPYLELAVAGSGAIATGLAALATVRTETVWLLARSQESADAAMETVVKTCGRIDGADASCVKATTDPADLAGANFVVEAIIEDHEAKTALLGTIGAAAPDADLATTTSSLSVTAIGEDCGMGDRLFALHVFNPVPVMDLIEICIPEAVDPAVGERVHKWCRALGKTSIDVPDTPGFVVNRLLFPYLFDAVRLQERTGMTAADVDTCMTLGVKHPMGPLSLLDLVGLDVSQAIGTAIHADTGNPDHEPPALIAQKVEAGDLGRKTGRGFYDYN